MSSITGRKRADGQQLSWRLAALAAPLTLHLNHLARHPSTPGRRLVDVASQVIGLRARNDAVVTEMEVDGADGPLPARLYVPHGVEANGGLLVHFHGGGFVFGSLDSHDMTCRFTARHSGCKVLAVGYRKAPEHRFPAAFEDCRAAFRWAVANADKLGVAPDRIGVGGDSAGGQLSAAVALHTDDGPRPAFAFLIYPLLDADVNAHESAWLFERGPLLTRRNTNDYVEHYVPTDPQRTDPRMTVLHADGLERMPPTFIATAGMDPIRDQGEAFARALQAAGATVTTQRFTDLPHGFNLLFCEGRARAAYTQCCRTLGDALAA